LFLEGFKKLAKLSSAECEPVLFVLKYGLLGTGLKTFLLFKNSKKEDD